MSKKHTQRKIATILPGAVLGEAAFFTSVAFLRRAGPQMF
jgi:hypothetical protein